MGRTEVSLCMDNAREGGSLEAAADGPVSFFLLPSLARSLPRCGLLLCLGGLWVEDTALDEPDFFLVLLFFFALRELNWGVEEPRAGPWKEDWRLDHGVRGLQAQTSVMQKIDQGDRRNEQNGRRKISC